MSGQKGLGTLMVRRIGNGDEEDKEGQGSPLKSFGQNLNQTLDLSRVEDQFGFDDDSMMQIDSQYDIYEQDDIDPARTLKELEEFDRKYSLMREEQQLRFQMPALG